MPKRLSILFILFFNVCALAEKWQNSYISFNLPNQWSCSLHGGEWVCRPKNTTQTDALIVFTAKIAGPTDNLNIYLQKLNSQRSVTDQNGNTHSSQIQVRARPIKINGHEWLESLQFSSEIHNYYTRYAATIKGRLAVLATFSSHRDAYSRYATEFYNSLLSLRVLSDGRQYFNDTSPDITPLPTFPGKTNRHLLPIETSKPRPKACSGIRCYLSRRNIITGLGALLLIIGLALLLERKKK